MATAPDQKLGGPKQAARALRELLARKVAAAIADERLDRDLADEFAKIGASLERLERCGYDLRLAALEVTERLSEQAKRLPTEPKCRAWLGQVVAALLADLEGEA